MQMSQTFYQIKVISSQVKFFCRVKMLFLFSNVTLTNEGNIVGEAVIVGCQNYVKCPPAHATHITFKTTRVSRELIL